MSMIPLLFGMTSGFAAGLVSWAGGASLIPILVSYAVVGQGGMLMAACLIYMFGSARDHAMCHEGRLAHLNYHDDFHFE